MYVTVKKIWEHLALVATTKKICCRLNYINFILLDFGGVLSSGAYSHAVCWTCNDILEGVADSVIKIDQTHLLS